MDFDLVVTNGIIVTASEVLQPGLDIGIKNGKISCIGTSLPISSNTKTIDAEGAYITPGGVDSHVHLAQKNAPTGDTWETGTRSAIAGGTTTVLAFASQQREDTSLYPVLEDYQKKSTDQCYCDYGFHFILTNPTPEILDNELPLLAQQEGITSVKLYMTYDLMKLNDREILKTLFACRKLGMTTMIHAESHDMISTIIEGLERNKNTDPFFHALARPRIAEDEASYRAISLAELADSPILIVHMSSDVAVSHVRDAQTRLLPIHAETCPHYLFLLSSKLQPEEPSDPFSGAKHICSPPLRHSPSDLESLWRALANGTITTWSSDHAPSKYAHPEGKRKGLINNIPQFTKIPNGLPGIETRLPLLFDKTPACSGSKPQQEAPRISLPRFVQLTSTHPAALYGLSGTKGSIAPGYDADLVIWHPPAAPSSNSGSNGGSSSVSSGETIISQAHLHHDIDYTPFEGVRVGNWPRYTILRGRVVWDRAKGIVGEKGFGRYLKRGKGEVLVGRVGNMARGMMGDEREFWM